MIKNPCLYALLNSGISPHEISSKQESPGETCQMCHREKLVIITINEKDKKTSFMPANLSSGNNFEPVTPV
jgi:hypothetical protein